MQNRIIILLSLFALLVSYFVYTVSTEAAAEAEKYLQRIENPVGLSPSPVRLQAREGQVFLTERASGEEKKQDSQGGKQESEPKTSPIGGVVAKYNEAVAELVQNNAPAKPVQRSNEKLKWVDNNGTVHFSDQRKGESAELENPGSYVNTDVSKSADL